MGYFSFSDICTFCNSKVGLNRYNLKKDLCLCPKCYKLCSNYISDNIFNYTKEDIINVIKSNTKKFNVINNFSATHTFSLYKKDILLIDTNNKQWYIPNKELFRNNIPDILNFSDIISYEVLENGCSLTSNAIGSALVGGLILGGVGALIGATSASRRIKKKITSLKIKLTIKNFDTPTIYINIIDSPSGVNKSNCKNEYLLVEKVVSTLELILKENDTLYKQITHPSNLNINKFCNVCGSKLGADFKFCNSCGSKCVS